MPVSDDVVTWGFRLLLGMEPEGRNSIEFHRAGYDTLEGLRTSFMRTPQAQALFKQANARPGEAVSQRPGYQIPPFLLRRPQFPDVPWLFTEPSLTAPVCQLCTSEQMAGPEYQNLCTRLGLGYDVPHRKFWEFAYILAVLQGKGLLAPGRRGIGFGTGREPLPAVFAAAGVTVTATDAPADLNFSDAWAQSAQWTEGLEDLFHPNLVTRDVFFDKVQYRPADMNNIPADLNGYDFCWSACCLEHLGSIRHGLDFIRNSLNTLRPGGVAVHTTEFNLQSEQDTMETPALSLFRKGDIELVLHELIADGHHVEPLNLWPGTSPVDEHIDLPPFSLPHLKLELEGYLTTSIGLIVTKREG
jgi:SAM-dependent methyltransferase